MSKLMTSKDYGKMTRRILNNCTRYELMRLLKNNGLYNDYKDCSNQYIIDRFVMRAEMNKKVYRI